MKKSKMQISVKWKLTLLYTFFMTLLACVIIAILLSLSNETILASIQTELKESVENAFQDIGWDDGGLDIDNDIMEVEQGIYLSVYNENSEIIYGKIPHGFMDIPPMQEGQLRTLQDSGTRWYVYDSSADIEGYGKLYVRGIVSVTRAEESITIFLRFTLILLPLMVLLTAFIGYRFTKRVMRPLYAAARTAEEIYESGDLSKRIPEGRGNDELHKLIQCLNQMLEWLEETFAREKQFTSDVSHELRTPVAVILSQCENLLDEEEIPKKFREDVEVIKRKAAAMSRMISQLLMLSRADQNRLELNRELVDLSILAEIVAEEQQEIADKKSIIIYTKVEPELTGYADETMLIRLFVNLLGNAVRYGVEGGIVEFALWREGERICGSVKDNGIGISKEALPHIWERFYQEDPTRNRSDESGAGLGLPMVKWIVQMHGGEIWAESEKGKGSTFGFWFPQKKIKM